MNNINDYITINYTNSAVLNMVDMANITKPQLNIFSDFTYKKEFKNIFPLGKNYYKQNLTDGAVTVFFSSPLEYHAKIEDVFIKITIKKLNFSFIVEKTEDFERISVDHLLFLWNNYALEEDDNLTDDAKKLKKTIKSIYSI